MSEADGMKKYWDRAASGSKVNWHIAHIDDEEEFLASGWAKIAKIFPDGLDVIPKGAYVLDIGCGKGRISRALALERPDIRVFGIDVSEKMISLAHAQSRDIGNLTYVIGDGTSLSVFPPDMFDFAFSYIVFQHLPRHVTQRYVEDVGRVLRPGGRFTFQVQSVPQPQEVDPRWNNYRKIRYYTPNQAELLVTDPVKLTGTRGDGHDFFVEARKDAPPAVPSEGAARAGDLKRV
jgi:SAM-dependent methyltransferase